MQAPDLRIVLVLGVLALIAIVVVQTKSNSMTKEERMENTAMAPVHTNFDLAFTDGHHFNGEDNAIIPVHVLKVGDLQVSSGKVMACDPGILSPNEADGFAFEKTVPNGHHPVFISHALVGKDHKRVAAVKVQFKDDKVVKWEMALRAGQHMKDLKPNERFGYGVDCGTGCFADPIIFKGLAPENYDESTTEKLFAEMDEHEGEWGAISLPKGNLIAVHSGWGDGFYPSYWGLNSSGQPVCLATDFEVLLTPIMGRVVLNNLPAHFGKTVDSAELKETRTDIMVKPVPGKQDAVLLEITGEAASSVDIEHKKTKGVKQSTVQYTGRGKNIEIEFSENLSKIELTLDFSKGTKAFE